MQTHLQEHQEIVDRLKVHIVKQKWALEQVELSRQEVRTQIRAEEDAKERLRKARTDVTAGEDPYTADEDSSKGVSSQSSPFSSTYSGTQQSDNFSKAASPFMETAGLTELKNQYERRFLQQDQQAAEMRQQLSQIHAMLLQVAGTKQPAPSTPTPQSPLAPTTTGPTGTPVASSPTAHAPAERLPAREGIQTATGVQRGHETAKAARASKQATMGKAARAASVEARRRTPAPPEVNAEVPLDVQSSDEETGKERNDGTGQGF